MGTLDYGFTWNSWESAENFATNAAIQAYEKKKTWREQVKYKLRNNLDITNSDFERLSPGRYFNDFLFRFRFTDIEAHLSKLSSPACYSGW